MIKLRKVIIFIIAICAVAIGFFLWYISSGIDSNEVYYNTLLTYEDVVYKTIENEKLTLDILMPAHVKHDEIPVIFYVHGGGFVSGEKSDLTDGVRRYVAEELLDDGYAIISIDFRNLDEDTHFPDNLTDVKDAIRFITSTAEEYNLDTNNYGIMGNGSGAYISLAVGYTPSGIYLGDYDLREYDCEVNYVIDFSGLTNISTYRDITGMTPEKLAEAQAELDTLYGTGMDIYNLTEADYEIMEQYDPISFISNDTIPTYIIHGLLDEAVSITQSNILETKLLEYNDDQVVYEYYKVLGGDSNLTDLAESERAVIVYNIVYFIKTYYVDSE